MILVYMLAIYALYIPISMIVIIILIMITEIAWADLLLEKDTLALRNEIADYLGRLTWLGVIFIGGLGLFAIGGHLMLIKSISYLWNKLFIAQKSKRKNEKNSNAKDNGT